MTRLPIMHPTYYVGVNTTGVVAFCVLDSIAQRFLFWV